MFSPVGISASPKQMSRLRNGHKVRIMKGEGVNLLIDPSKLNTITRAFDKGKGVMVQLSPEEISANRSIEGEGIFGKKFDKLLKKGGIKKSVFEIADALKPVVKEGVKAGVKAVPEKYRPLADAGAAMTLAYVEDPEKYQSAKGAAKLAQIGAVSGAKSAASQQLKGMKKGSTTPTTKGSGLYMGSRGAGVGARGSLLSVHNSSLPPAMQSQNTSANFHFSTQLPPALAHSKLVGGGLYM